MDIFQAVILGIVEGLTEFLPVSSTGHMILAGHFLGVNQDDDFVKTFEIAVQLGSILAVIFVLWRHLIHGLDVWVKLMIGFIPTGIIGFFAYKWIKMLFVPETVAYMLIIGGIVFLMTEYWILPRKHKNKIPKEGLDKISYKEAFIIGLCQSLAMIPGTSRSGATIIAGLWMGLSRTLAAEFSFLLAIPTMLAATSYDLYKNYALLDWANSFILLLGGIVAFIVALLAIKLFLGFVKRFSYISFGFYRIVLGGVFLWYFWMM